RLNAEAALAEPRLGRLASLARLAHDVADDDARTLVGEAQRDRAPESGAPAGDDRDASFEAHDRSSHSTSSRVQGLARARPWTRLDRTSCATGSRVAPCASASSGRGGSRSSTSPSWSG